MSYENIKQEFTKERIHVVEIDVPRCVLVHGAGACTASETGDDKCYNTLSTCNDLANYNDQIVIDGFFSIFAAGGSIDRISGSFITDGLQVGQIITTSGFADSGNNSEFELLEVTAGEIIVKNNAGMVNQSTTEATITASNIYTYKHCTNRSPHPFNMNNYAPCVEGVSIAPAQIDPKGGIGARTSASISFGDFPSSDGYGIDPYLSDRTYDPLTRGSYWTKWRVRNANYENYSIRILTGYIVDNQFDSSNFEPRYYVLSTLNATGGKASIKAKDPLQLVSNKDSLYPPASRGQLSADLPLANTSFSITPTGAGADYPASGFYVKIRNEVILVNTRSGDSFSSVTRGQFNTVADDHSDNDTVQLCIEFDGTLRLDEVVKQILVDGAGVPVIYIPIASWKAEAELYLTSNPFRLLTDPTSTSKLIEQLCTEWPHQLYWNDKTRKIEMSAIKVPEVGTLYNTFNSDGQLMELSTRDRPDMQLSTVFLRYGQFDPTKKQDETDNYRVTYGRANTDAIVRYNSNNAKVINCLWVSALNGGQANKIGQIHGRRFGITPREVGFMLEDKDSSLWIGDVINVNYFDICDQNGLSIDTPFQILSASENGAYEYNGLQYSFDQFLPGVDIDVAVNAVIYSNDQKNINLLADYTTTFGAPSASTEAIFIVESGVRIGSDSTATPSVLTGSWPTGATVTLEVRSSAFVVGAGGNGSSSASTAGLPGGDAIELNYPLTLTNSGTVGGGGGGGGAATQNGFIAGGGGGAGDNIGIAGVNDLSGTGTITSAISPTSGSIIDGGDQGRVNYTIGGEPFTVIGGTGGDLGQAGQAGVEGSGTSAGGAAGKAVEQNGNLITIIGNTPSGLVS